MRLLMIKDHEGSEALINIEHLSLVTKPTLKSCTNPKSTASVDKYVLEIYFIGTKTALFFDDKESAMDQYQEIILAAKEIENINFPEFDRVPSVPDDSKTNTLDWKYIEENYTPGRGDVGISPIK